MIRLGVFPLNFLLASSILFSMVDGGVRDVACPTGCSTERCQCSEDETGVFVVCEGLTESFSNCLDKNVIEFQLHGSSLTTIGPGDFRNDTKLETLDITGNFKLEKIEEHAFRELKQLRRLLLDSNGLTKLEESIFPTDGRLEEIRLNNNKIEKIRHEVAFEGLEKSLKDLRLAFNKLEEFVCPKLHRLSVLDLRENRLRPLEKEMFRECPNVVEINLSGNLIRDLRVNWTVLRDLHTLDLNDNEIREVERDFQESLPNLRYLSMAFNQLRVIPPLPTDLLGLMLSGNHFETIRKETFRNLTQLTFLEMSDLPYLTTIEEAAFAGLRTLSRLALNYNRNLSSLPPRPWPDSRELMELKLDYNNISIFDRSLFDELDSLWSADINGNPIHCSCDNSWIRIEMDNRENFWIDPWKNGTRSVSCRTPDNLEGFLISQLNAYDLTCSLSRMLENSLTTTSDGFILQAVLVEGVPSTSWYFPDGRRIYAHRQMLDRLQEDPPIEEILWENLTILARLTLPNTGYEPGPYVLEWTNAGGSDNFTFTVGVSTGTPPPHSEGSHAAAIAVTILSIGMVILFAVGGYFLYGYLKSSRLNTIQPMEEDPETMSTADAHVQNEPDGSSLLTPTAGYGSTNDTFGRIE